MTKKRKIIVAVALGITALALVFVVGKTGIVPVYGVRSVFQTPGTCSTCHETWYNEATYAFNPKGNAKPPSSGLTIGCAECHPVQYEEYKISAMGSSKSALRPGCTNCHDKTHSVLEWFSFMYLGNKNWTQMVQLSLRDRGMYNTKLGPRFAPKVRARFIKTNSARCRECHLRDDKSLFKGTLGVYRPNILPHKKAKEQNITCIQCHQNLTHNLSLPVAWHGKPNMARKGNFEAGKRKSEVCADCHEADGNSLQSEFPSIAGLNFNYISLQLRAFKTGKRKSDIMQGIVADLSDQDIADVAAYYSKQKMHATLTLPKVQSLRLRANLQIGESLYRKSCARCHGLTGLGQGIFPALAGQYSDYTFAQMTAFKKGKREKHSIMRDVTGGFKDGDLKLIAKYLATLK
jgi:cytochrome c553